MFYSPSIGFYFIDGGILLGRLLIAHSNAIVSLVLYSSYSLDDGTLLALFLWIVYILFFIIGSKIAHMPISISLLLVRLEGYINWIG